jgi:LysM repeat protein
MTRKLLYSDFIIKISLVVILLFYACSAYDIVSANTTAYKSGLPYQTIHVQYGDTVWSIAAKRVSEKEDIRKLITTIKLMNGLSQNVDIYPGQALKVPLRN